MIYIPRGKMCIACKKVNNDCSKLDFKKMTILGVFIDVLEDITIVKCSEFESKDK